MHDCSFADTCSYANPCSSNLASKGLTGDGQQHCEGTCTVITLRAFLPKSHKQSLPRKRMPALRAAASSLTRCRTWHATSTVLKPTCRSEKTTHEVTLCQWAPSGALACKSMQGCTVCWLSTGPSCSGAADVASFFLRPLLFTGLGSSAAAGLPALLLSSASVVLTLLAASNSMSPCSAAAAAGVSAFFLRPPRFAGLATSAAAGSSKVVLSASTAESAASAAFLRAQVRTSLRPAPAGGRRTGLLRAVRLHEDVGCTGGKP